MMHDPATTRTWLRDPSVDGILVALAGCHAAVLLLWPNMLTLGLGLWWNANTVSHYFIHRPYFRSSAANRSFSVGLSLLLCLPQSIWRDRHLAHHAEAPPRIRWNQQLGVECLAVGSIWIGLAVTTPAFFLMHFLPGIVLGLTICAVHGHFEHAGRTISHYGFAYNALFLSDGHHVEHHASPTKSWCALRRERIDDNPSAWPAALRWLSHPLELLERLVILSPMLQRFVLRTHRRAWQRLLPRLHGAHRIGIVGGGLYPRTALILQELLPGAELTIIDSNESNLTLARNRLGESVRYDLAWFDPLRHHDFDALVFPLDFRGDTAQLDSAAPLVVRHVWLWRSGGETALVSPWLLKRLNLRRAA